MLKKIAIILGTRSEIIKMFSITRQRIQKKHINHYEL